jgi:3-oxoacyl-[acyl-carrier-protein] synthase II
MLTAMREALAQAGVAPEDVGGVIAFAGGSPTGDEEEGQAITDLLGKVPVTAPKAQTGDCLEASGAIHLAVAIEAILEGKIPPIARLEEVDPAFGQLDLVLGRAREATLNHVLVNARDESGHCAAAVISRYQ